MDAYTCVYIHTHVFTRIDVSVYIHTHIFTSIDIYMHAYIYVNIHMHTLVNVTSLLLDKYGSLVYTATYTYKEIVRK